MTLGRARRIAPQVDKDLLCVGRIQEIELRWNIELRLGCGQRDLALLEIKRPDDGRVLRRQVRFAAEHLAICLCFRNRAGSHENRQCQYKLVHPCALENG
ncbi:hypothetical protein D9M72_563980 [compost metagenome]